MSELPQNRFLIRTITIMPDGVTLEFMDTEGDLRESGLQLQHALFVPDDEEYEDEIQALLDSAHALLLDGLQDYGNTPALSLRQIAKDAEAAVQRDAGVDPDEDDEERAPDADEPSYYDMPRR